MTVAGAFAILRELAGEEVEPVEAIDTVSDAMDALLAAAEAVSQAMEQDRLGMRVNERRAFDTLRAAIRRARGRSSY